MTPKQKTTLVAVAATVATAALAAVVVLMAAMSYPGWTVSPLAVVSVALNAVLSVCTNLAVVWVAGRFLPVRYPRALFASALLQMPAQLLIQLTGLQVLSVVGLLVCYALIPVVCWRAPLWQRAVCAVLIIVLVMVCESVGSLSLSVLDITPVWAVSMTQLPSVLVRAVYLVALCASGAGLGMLVRRTVARWTGEGWLRYGAFLVLQMATLLALFYPPYFAVSPARVYVDLLPAVVVCVAADVAAMVSLRRFSASEREAERERVAAERLDAALRRARATLDRAAAAARFRHDERNHLQVLRGLVAQGNADEALAYVRALRAEIAAANGAAGDDADNASAEMGVRVVVAGAADFAAGPQPGDALGASAEGGAATGAADSAAAGKSARIGAGDAGEGRCVR